MNGRDFTVRAGGVKRLVVKWVKHYMHRRWLAEDVQELILEERRRCAQIAMRFTVKPDPRIHPDIPWKEMDQGAKTVAHMTALQITLEISKPIPLDAVSGQG